MRILVLGAGAIGGYFGGRLAASGSDVTFLVRPKRAELLAGGLKIESPSDLGNAEVQVKTILAGDAAGPFDVILLTCKAYDLDDALDTIALYAEDAAIVPLLNGLAHLEQIETRLPGSPVLAGSVICGATVKPDGTIVHLAPPHVMTIGLRPGQEELAPRAQALHDAVAASGVGAVLHDDIVLALWEKWVFLATLAAATCTMRGNTGQILATSHGRGQILALLEECTATATAAGSTPTAAKLDEYTQFLTKPGSTFSASMLRDMTAGGPIEADHVIGDLIRRAASHGIETPLLKMALTHLEVYEAQRQT